MKYIRTKYGIYNAIKEFKIGDMIGVPYNGLVKIIAQADTIEELCDEFLLIDEKYKHDFFIDHYYDEIIDIYNDEKERVYRQRKLFGAIWTDKGLIYVARMNSKGELELLWNI